MADAGISLSVAEASVASPFTYKQKDVSCVPNLLKEGRCTLVAVFGAFKYQVCYCFILLGAVLILFWYGTKPSEGRHVKSLINTKFDSHNHKPRNIRFDRCRNEHFAANVVWLNNAIRQASQKASNPKCSKFCSTVIHVLLYIDTSVCLLVC